MQMKLFEWLEKSETWVYWNENLCGEGIFTAFTEYDRDYSLEPKKEEEDEEA